MSYVQKTNKQNKHTHTQTHTHTHTHTHTNIGSDHKLSQKLYNKLSRIRSKILRMRI